MLLRPPFIKFSPAIYTIAKAAVEDANGVSEYTIIAQ